MFSFFPFLCTTQLVIKHIQINYQPGDFTVNIALALHTQEKLDNFGGSKKKKKVVFPFPLQRMDMDSGRILFVISPFNT